MYLFLRIISKFLYTALVSIFVYSNLLIRKPLLVQRTMQRNLYGKIEDNETIFRSTVYQKLLLTSIIISKNLIDLQTTS